MISRVVWRVPITIRLLKLFQSFEIGDIFELVRRMRIRGFAGIGKFVGNSANVTALPVVVNGVDVPYSSASFEPRPFHGCCLRNTWIWCARKSSLACVASVRMLTFSLLGLVCLWPDGWSFRCSLMPNFIYLTNLQGGDVRAVERAFAACTRSVFRLSRYDSTRGLGGRLLGCSILDYLKYRRSVFLHSLAISETPG